VAAPVIRLSEKWEDGMHATARRRHSFGVLFKSAVGSGVLALVLFGVVAPHFIDRDPSVLLSVAVTALGAALGALLALKD